MTAVGEARADPRQTTATRRPVGTALAATLAPWGFVVANSCYTIATRSGGSDSTGAETLVLFAAHPTLTRVATIAVMVGSLLLVPAITGILAHLGRTGLARVGGWLMIVGYIGYLSVASTNVLQLAMATYGGPQGDFAAVIDQAQADPTGAWTFLLFVIGNLIGTVLFAVGLLRSRTVPVWTAIVIMSWPVLHVIGLVVGNEIFEVTGAVLQAVGFAGVAGVLLRR